MKANATAIVNRLTPTAPQGAPRPSALAGLQEFMQRRRMQPPGKDFAQFEAELHEKVMEVERELLAEDMVRADVNAPAIVFEGRTWRRAVRAEETYMTRAGEVRVMRTLYRDRTDLNDGSIVPMELRLGIVEGFWTPLAAKHGHWLVSQMTPQLAEELLERTGNMKPSKSSLDRLPKALNARWEESREEFEAALRDAMVIPPEARSICISVDGVLAPMKDAGGPATRRRAAAAGKIAKGPAGYREVGCGTISFCDKTGKMLSAIRIARMPESTKRTLKRSLLAELSHVLTLRPDLAIVKVADAAEDNWSFLSHEVPDNDGGASVIDFFHAAEHLSAAIAAVYGDGTHETRRRFHDLRGVLLEDPQGVEKVIRALDYLRRTHASDRTVATALRYFRKHRHKMRYADLKSRGLPVGSGVVEAACKTLVAQRMKQSGMRWGQEGGQAILTGRGWTQSQRFDHAWALLSATYVAEITLLNNVFPLPVPTAQERR